MSSQKDMGLCQTCLIFRDSYEKMPKPWFSSHYLWTCPFREIGARLQVYRLLNASDILPLCNSYPVHISGSFMANLHSRHSNLDFPGNKYNFLLFVRKLYAKKFFGDKKKWLLNASQEKRKINSPERYLKLTLCVYLGLCVALLMMELYSVKGHCYTLTDKKMKKRHY